MGDISRRMHVFRNLEIFGYVYIYIYIHVYQELGTMFSLENGICNTCIHTYRRNSCMYYIVVTHI